MYLNICDGGVKKNNPNLSFSFNFISVQFMNCLVFNGTSSNLVFNDTTSNVFTVMHLFLITIKNEPYNINVEMHNKFPLEFL